MAELLVRIVDKPWEIRSWRHSTLRWAYHTKAGDVIYIGRNGHQWGNKEVRSDIWRIFCLPEYPCENFDEMLASETHWYEKVQARIRYFDLSGSWVRGLILSGGVICLTGDDAKRFLGLRRQRVSALPMRVA